MKRNEKLKELEHELNKKAKDHLKQITENAKDERDCIDKLTTKLQNLAYEFVERDAYFDTVPQEKVDEIKCVLEPFFRMCFVTFYSPSHRAF